MGGNTESTDPKEPAERAGVLDGVLTGAGTAAVAVAAHFGGPGAAGAVAALWQMTIARIPQQHHRRQETFHQAAQAQIAGLGLSAEQVRRAAEDSEFVEALSDLHERVARVRGQGVLIALGAAVAGSMTHGWSGRHRLAERIWFLIADLSEDEISVLRAAWDHRQHRAFPSRQAGDLSSHELAEFSQIDLELAAACIERLRGLGLFRQIEVGLDTEWDGTSGPQEVQMQGGEYRLTSIAHDLFTLLESGGMSESSPTDDHG